MKKTSILTILTSVLALASCSLTTTSRKVKRNSKAENDSDPISEITDDETPVTEEDTEHEQTIDDEQNISVPEEDERETVEDGSVISAAGSYTLKGNYSSVSITAAKNSEIYVYLDGATINSSTGIAFGSSKAITLHLVIINESENTIINDFADTNAFHVKGNVLISGVGILNVESKQKNAIKDGQSLTITQTTINVKAKKSAITAESIVAEGCTLNLEAEGDGIQADADDDLTTFSKERGYTYLKNVTLTYNGTGDGIQSETYTDINGGTINIKTEGTFVPYSQKDTYELTDDDYKWNSSHKRVAKDSIRSYSSMYALANSVKAIKVGPIKYEDDDKVEHEVTTGEYSISIRGLAGITLNSTDDAIHCNYGSISLESANMDITTSDDGVHADYNTNINNTSLVVNDSYEGIEGQNVTISGENTNIVVNSQDDGINAASDFGSSYVCTINNGFVRVKAGGDGLDSNTTLNINGGKVIIEGPGSGNGSLDADRVNINGGIVFACSNNGMLENMSATQPTFIYNGSTMSANSVISVADANNEDSALYTYTLKLSCTQLIFSSPEMKVGSTYTIFNGDNVITDINMTSTLTKVGTSSGGPGGGGHGPGGW